MNRGTSGLRPGATTADPTGPPAAMEDSTRIIAQGLRQVDVGTTRLRIILARRLSISVSELNALIHIRDTGDITPKQIAYELNLTTGSVTALTDRLQKARFLPRHPNPSDRRSLLLHLTPTGDHAVQWACQQLDDAVASVLTDVPGLPVAILADFLERIASALNNHLELQQGLELAALPAKKPGTSLSAGSAAKPPSQSA